MNNIFKYLSSLILIGLCFQLQGAIEIANITYTSGNGTCDGAIEVKAEGTAGPFTISLTKLDGTSVDYVVDINGSYTFSGLCADTYNVSVSSELVCEQTIEVDLESCSGQITIVPSIQSRCVEAVEFSIENYLFNYVLGTGSIELDIQGGTAPYLFEWSDSDITTKDRYYLSDGTYQVTVTDNCGIQNIESFSLNSLKLISVQPIHGCGFDDGEIKVNVTGGLPPYTFRWIKDGETFDISASSNKTGLTSGEYKILVTDANGCSLGELINVNLQNLLNDIVLNRPCKGLDNGSIDLYYNQLSFDPVTITISWVNEIGNTQEREYSTVFWSIWGENIHRIEDLKALTDYEIKININGCTSIINKSTGEQEFEEHFSSFQEGWCHYDLYCNGSFIVDNGSTNEPKADILNGVGDANKKRSACYTPIVCEANSGVKTQVGAESYKNKKTRALVYEKVLEAAEAKKYPTAELREALNDAGLSSCDRVRYCPATLKMKALFTIFSESGDQEPKPGECFDYMCAGIRYEACASDFLPDYLLDGYIPPAEPPANCDPVTYSLYQIDLWREQMESTIPNYTNTQLYAYINERLFNNEEREKYPCQKVTFCFPSFDILDITPPSEDVNCHYVLDSLIVDTLGVVKNCEPYITSHPEYVEVFCHNGETEGDNATRDVIRTTYYADEFLQYITGRVAINSSENIVTKVYPSDHIETIFKKFALTKDGNYINPKGIFEGQGNTQYQEFAHHAQVSEVYELTNVTQHIDDWENDEQIYIEKDGDGNSYFLVYETSETSWLKTISSTTEIDIRYLSKDGSNIVIGGSYNGDLLFDSTILDNGASSSIKSSFLLNYNTASQVVENVDIIKDIEDVQFERTASGTSIGFIAPVPAIETNNINYSTTAGSLVQFNISNSTSNQTSTLARMEVNGAVEENNPINPNIEILGNFELLKIAQDSDGLNTSYLLSGMGDIVNSSDTFSFSSEQILLMTVDDTQNIKALQPLGSTTDVNKNYVDLEYDDFGNLYLGLTFNNIISIGESNQYSSNGGTDILLVKYSSCGLLKGAAHYGSSEDENVSELLYNQDLLYFGGDFKGSLNERVIGKYKFINLTSNAQNAYISFILDEDLNTGLATSNVEISNIKPAFVGQCNGTITLSVNATADNAYNWVGPDNFTSNDANLSGLCAGTYTLLITNSGGCQQEITAIVTECTIDIEPEIQAICIEGGVGSIAFTSSNVNEYTFTWANGQTGTESGGLQAGSHCVTITNIAENCSVEQCYTIESLIDVTSDDYASCLPNSAPIIINEVSNGSGGSKEYVELLVVGDGSCNNVDIRGFIIDDNNGDFSNTSNGYSSSGIAGGHIRFAFVSQWSSVPVGSLILLYNSGDKNPSIALADDPTDSDADKVYVLPHTDSSLEGVSILPVAASDSLHSHYSPSQHTYGSASWSYLALYNSRDAIQIRYPNGTYCHGVSYGGSSYMTGGSDDLRLRPYSSSKKAFFFNSGDFTDKANFDYDNVSNGVETPGYVNNTDNESFINNICNGGTTTRIKDSKVIKTNAPVFIGRVYPNPFTKSIHFDINSTREQEINITLYDLLGKVVHSSNHNVSIGFNTLKINTSKANLAEGVYQIIIIDSMGKQHKQRLVHTK